MIEQKPLSTKIKLLHFCSYTWEAGGPPNVIYSHAKIQNKNGIEISVASTLEANQQPYLASPDLEVIQFPKSILAKILPDFSWEQLVWFYQNRNQFDIIQIHGLWNNGSVIPFFIPSKAKIIITVHGFLDPYVRKKGKFKKFILWHLFQKFTFHRADLIHTISQDECNEVKRLFPELTHKIVYLPNGIDDPIDNAQESSQEFKLKVDRFIEENTYTCLFLGRINHKKGLDILLSSALQLQNSGNYNIKFIIAGPDDGYLTELNSFIEMHQLSQILVLPRVIGAEKEYLFNISDAFILTSYSEGFSIAAMEALAHGKTGIFSQYIGFADEIAQYKAGLICDTNSNSLTKCLLHIYQNPNLNKKLQENGRGLFKNHFHINLIAEQMVRHIKRLVH